MKKAPHLSNPKVPVVSIDPSLDQYHDLFPEKLAKANEMLKTTRLPPQAIRTLMTKEEVETKLCLVFDNALNGDDYPVRLILASGRVLEGFRIIEHTGQYILGFTSTQRELSMRETEIIGATLVAKDKIVRVLCPELDFRSAA